MRKDNTVENTVSKSSGVGKHIIFVEYLQSGWRICWEGVGNKIRNVGRAHIVEGLECQGYSLCNVVPSTNGQSKYIWNPLI